MQGVRRLSVVLVLVALAACGRIDSPDFSGTPLLVLKGRIAELPASIEVRSLRAAFVWIRYLMDGGVAFVAQDVAIDPEFPARFSLDILNLPPDDVMVSGSDLGPEYAGATAGFGRLIIYNDRNGNGRLDVLSKTDTEAIDQVLGPVEEYFVAFLEGDAPQKGTADVLCRGMNLLSLVYDTSDSDDSTLSLLPIDAEIDVTLADSPQLQKLMCTEQPASSSVSVTIGEVPPDQLASLPADAWTLCQEDGTLFSFSYLVTTQEGVCGDMMSQMIQGFSRVSPDTEWPTEWPCEKGEYVELSCRGEGASCYWAFLDPVVQCMDGTSITSCGKKTVGNLTTMCYDNGARKVSSVVGQLVVTTDMYGPSHDLCYHATNDLVGLNSARMEVTVGGMTLVITLSTQEIEIVCSNGSVEKWPMDVWTQLFAKCSPEIGMSFSHLTCGPGGCP